VSEESRLRSAERIANLLAPFCIIAWRILWLTQAHRTHPQTAPQAALRDREILILDSLILSAGANEPQAKTLAIYVRKLARLGVHLGRSRDSPPGAMVLWRGLSASPTSNSDGKPRSIQDVGNRKSHRRVTAQ
jgi:hypothetical protein